MLERRRAGRLNARVWTQVMGVDEAWRMRRCNLSVTGVFFDIDRDIGEPGSVQQLKLMTGDKLCHLDAMARVVRVFSTNDIWRGHMVAGVAFDFMLNTDEQRENVEQLVRYLFAGQQEGAAESAVAPQPKVEFTYSARIGSDTSAMVQAINVNGMVLETSWPATVGEVIRCEITAPNSRQRFTLEGQVVNTQTDADANGAESYSVEVSFKPGGAAAALEPALTQADGISINDAIDALLEEAVFQPVDTGFAIPNEHLKGLLSRIRVPSLLAFLEMERLTGTLVLKSGTLETQLFVREGSVVDCHTSQAHLDRMAALAQAFRWTEGSFEFQVGDMGRPDMIKMSTTHLLLRLSTEADEAGR